MVFKDEVMVWFQKLSGSQRIDIMCSLLQLCLPFEMKFFATYIEGQARTDFEYHLLRQVELNANDVGSSVDEPAPAAAGTGVGNQPGLMPTHVTQPWLLKNGHESLLDAAFRRKLIFSVAFLHANNRNSAAALHEALISPAAQSALLILNVSLHPIIQLNPEMPPRPLAGIDECLQELLLLYTLAVHHPAFNFEEKTKLRASLTNLQAIHQPCPTIEPSKSSVVAKSELLEGPIPILNGISRLSPIQVFQDPARNSEPYAHISTEISPNSSKVTSETSPARYAQRLGVGDVLNPLPPPVSLSSPITSSPTSPFQSPLSSPTSAPTQVSVGEGPDEPVKELKREHIKKLWPVLQQFSPTELKSSTDEELRACGLSPSSIPKLRQFLRNATATLPNGVCLPPRRGPTSPACSSTSSVNTSDQISSDGKPEVNGLPEASLPPPLRRNSRDSYPLVMCTLPSKPFSHASLVTPTNPIYVTHSSTNRPQPFRRHDPEPTPCAMSLGKSVIGHPNASLRSSSSYGTKSDSSVSVGSGSNSSASSIDSPSPPGSRIGSPALPATLNSQSAAVGSRSPYPPPPADSPNMAFPPLIPGPPQQAAPSAVRTGMVACGVLPNSTGHVNPRPRFFEPFPLATSMRPRPTALHNLSAGSVTLPRVSAPKPIRTVVSAPVLPTQANASNEGKAKYKTATAGSNPGPPCLNGSSVRFANPPAPSLNNPSSGNASRASSEAREVPPQPYCYPMTRIPYSVGSFVYANPHNLPLATSESNPATSLPGGGGGGGATTGTVNLAYISSPPYMPPPPPATGQQPPPHQAAGTITQPLLPFMENPPISSPGYASTSRSHGALMAAPIHQTVYAYPQYSFICDTTGDNGGANAAQGGGTPGAPAGVFYAPYQAGIQYILPPSMPPPPGNASYMCSPYYLSAPVLNPDLGNAGAPTASSQRPPSLPETVPFGTLLEPPAPPRVATCYNCGMAGHRGPDCKEKTIEECIKPAKPDS